MTTLVEPVTQAAIVYPESDGQPMADNTKQFRWIVTIEGGLEAQFQDDPNVFVAGNLLWYAVEGRPTIRVAPDAMVVFGRPKGDRGSYMQWSEGGIAPQVVFEVLSPGNTAAEMIRKYQFFSRYGVEEYYIYDPDKVELSGWVRADNELTEIDGMDDWVSPRLKIRFTIELGELALYHPDGRRFATYVELMRQREQAQQAAEQAQRAAEHERREREQAQQAAEQAQQQVEHERREREQAQQRAERLAAQLRALGIEPDAEA